jgi:integrase
MASRKGRQPRRRGHVIRYAGKRGVVWRVKYHDASGKQIVETLGPESEGWTEEEAEKALRDRLHRVEQKEWVRPRPLTFETFALQWLEDEEAPRRWKPKTINAYRHSVDRLVEGLGQKRLAELRPRHVAEYITAMSREGYSASSVNRDVSICHDILKSAKRGELVDSNAADDAARPKLPPFRPRILTPTEVQLIRRAFTDAQARVAFLVLVLCGVRQSELLNLRWRDVDLVENVLRVVESKSEDGRRSIAIPSMLAEELIKHVDRTAYEGADEYVFCHPTLGTRYRADAFAEAFEAARKTAGFPDMKIRPFHDLRHTYITNAAAAGMNAVALMTSAGHSDMKTTKRYLHLAGTVFRSEADALERRMLGALLTEPSTDLQSSEVVSAHDMSPSDTGSTSER